MTLSKKFENENLRLLIFQGSWCPMCVSAMPQLAHFISDNNIDEEKVEVINVNSYKTEPADRLKQYNITRVPTVVLLKEGVEQSRITEYAPNGWKIGTEELVNNI